MRSERDARAGSLGGDRERSRARTETHAKRFGARKTELRVLVTGGRDFTDHALLAEVMCRLTSEHRITALIHGGARGLDRFASAWALGYGIPIVQVDADWARHGKAAGPIRNREMLKYAPDVVLAFPGGAGTADMVRQATLAGVTVVSAVDYATKHATTLTPTTSLPERPEPT